MKCGRMVYALIFVAVVETACGGSSADTALVNAATKGDLEGVKQAFADGASMHARNVFGDTALIVASYYGHLDVVKCLLAKGASIDAKAWSGYTALMRASEDGHLDVVKCLAKGASIDAADENGFTALMYASGHGHLDVVKYLLAQGANVTVETTYGETAMDRAKTQDVRDVLQAALMEAASKKCQDTGGACHLFVQKLRGLFLGNHDELIKLGEDARRLIDKAGTDEQAARYRRDLLEKTEGLLTVRESTAAEKVIVRDVSFDWRARVLCHVERERGSLDKSYENFLCVELPKMKGKVAKYITEPLIEALDDKAAHLFDYDANGDDKLNKDEAMKWVDAMKEELTAGSRRLGSTAQSRRLYGNVEGFCEAASDVGREYYKKWEAVRTNNYDTKLTPLGLPLGIPRAAAGIAAAFFAAAALVCAVGFVVRRRSAEDSDQAEQPVLE